MPCGDLCEDPEIPVQTTGDDDYINAYESIGCYGDQSDRVLSGRSLLGYSGMTTEVRRGGLGLKPHKWEIINTRIILQF